MCGCDDRGGSEVEEGITNDCSCGAFATMLCTSVWVVVVDGEGAKVCEGEEDSEEEGVRGGGVVVLGVARNPKNQGNGELHARTGVRGVRVCCAWAW